MKLVCSFYIGHAGYLHENPEIDESESNYNFTQVVTSLISCYLGSYSSEGQTLISKNAEEISASLELLGHKIVTLEFGRETTLMDDEDGSEIGFPILMYVDAYFEVPEIIAEEIVELDEDGNLAEAIKNCNLKIGSNVLQFQGVPELL